MSDALRVEQLRKSFGGLVAVNGPTFGVAEGSITGLIGPNGSGKTTLFNLITGVIAPDAGRVLLQGAAITGWSPHRVAARGLARTFQISRIFGHMTVWENMLVVARQRSERDSQATADALLRRVDLYDFREHFGADLSYGQQRLLEVIRCLMLEPSVILLDEPFAGVNPTMAQTVVGLIRELRNEGKTVFIIDHAMTIIMSLCERILVLDMGELIADGPPSELQSNERVLEAYFGRARRTSLP